MLIAVCNNLCLLFYDQCNAIIMLPLCNRIRTLTESESCISLQGVCFFIYIPPKVKHHFFIMKFFSQQTVNLFRRQCQPVIAIKCWITLRYSGIAIKFHVTLKINENDVFISNFDGNHPIIIDTYIQLVVRLNQWIPKWRNCIVQEPELLN